MNIIPNSQIHSIDVNMETEHLAKAYISEKVVEKQAMRLSSHCISNLESCEHFLVSWNFKHIVNIDRIRGYNSVNLKLGHKMI